MTKPCRHCKTPTRLREFCSITCRFLAKVEVETGGCWRWSAYINRHGYGTFSIAPAMALAHRVSYRLFVSEIPDGLVIDHLCENHQCVNPQHLRAVTQQQNTLRSQTAHTAINARKTHCKRGHEFTEQNTRRTAGGNRVCRACDVIHTANYLARRAARLAEVAA
jgi:hypothetical protein